MTERKAVHYGSVKLIPEIECEGYILDDNTAVLSERGVANLLGMDHAPFKRMISNWPPKTLEPFVDKDLSVNTYSVKVTANNSPHKGQNIIAYDSSFIEAIIRAYALALANDVLRANQKHIGLRCTILICALILTALEAAIREACGLPTNIPKTAQQNYQYAVELLKASGFNFSVPNEIATKKDLTKFFKVPATKLNSFLQNPQNDIVAVKLERATALLHKKRKK